MTSTTTPSPGWRAALPAAVLPVLVAVGATGLFLVVRGALVDDSYITLSYARNLGLHGEWALVQGYQANTATSPLNVLILGGLIAIVRDPLVALGLLHVATCVAMALGLRGLGRTLGLGDGVAWIGTPLLLLNPLLASTLGLETLLVLTALVFMAWATAARQPVRFGLVAGACVWLRLDSVVLVATLFLLTPALLRGWWKAIAAAAAVALPWLVFSWVVLGSAIPDTLVLKQDGGFSAFSTGLFTRWGQSYPDAILASVAPAAAGLLAAASWWAWRRRLAAASTVVPSLAAAGVGYYLVIWLLGVSPYFWYYAPTIAALSLVAAIAATTLIGSGRPVLRGTSLAALATVALVMAYPWVQDLRAGLPLGAMPVHGNWALPHQYEKIGRELGRLVGDAGVRGPGEIGSLAYYCECSISDKFSDRSRTVELIDERVASSWLMRLNYHFLDREEIEPIVIVYGLGWRSGTDPTMRGWDARGRPESSKRIGHFELVEKRPWAGRQP